MFSNTFQNNSASECGGAIHFDKILSNTFFITQNTFINNSAPYGNDYSSYATRLFLKLKSLQSLKQKITIEAYPGVKIDNFNLTILDHFGQIVNVDDTGQ